MILTFQVGDPGSSPGGRIFYNFFLNGSYLNKLKVNVSQKKLAMSGKELDINLSLDALVKTEKKQRK